MHQPSYMLNCEQKQRRQKGAPARSLERTCAWGMGAEGSNFPAFAAGALRLHLGICFANKVFHYFSHLKSLCCCYEMLLKSLVCPDVSQWKQFSCTANETCEGDGTCGKRGSFCRVWKNEKLSWLPCRADRTHSFLISEWVIHLCAALGRIINYSQASGWVSRHTVFSRPFSELLAPVFMIKFLCLLGAAEKEVMSPLHHSPVS